MSQEPETNDDREDGLGMGRPPNEEVLGADLDDGAGPEENLLDTADVEELESAAPSHGSDAPRFAGDLVTSLNKAPSSLDEIVGNLRRAREDVGQISELSSEEGKLVEAFSLALLKLMTPLAKTIPIDPSALPGDLGEVERASINPEGALIILRRDSGLEAIDLMSAENRDLLVEVVKAVIPKFTGLISEQRGKIETRIGFLAAVTRELQNIAEALSHAF